MRKYTQFMTSERHAIEHDVYQFQSTSLSSSNIAAETGRIALSGQKRSQVANFLVSFSRCIKIAKHERKSASEKAKDLSRRGCV